jgi:hypothetical protein
METAKENGLKPYEYLTFLFSEMPNAVDQNLDAVPHCCRMPVMQGD